MNKITAPARIVVTRTAVVESLLQEIWHLNPDIKGKISVTVVMAFRALIKECTREQASFAAELVNYKRAAAVAHSQGSSPYPSTVPTVSAVQGDGFPDEPHPDSSWD